MASTVRISEIVQVLKFGGVDTVSGTAAQRLTAALNASSGLVNAASATTTADARLAAANDEVTAATADVSAAATQTTDAENTADSVASDLQSYATTLGTLASSIASSDPARAAYLRAAKDLFDEAAARLLAHDTNGIRA